MRIYVAASYPRRGEARGLKGKLELAGHVVTSRWLLDAYEGGYAGEQFSGEKASQEDVEDVEEADGVVVITGDDQTRGGRHAEVGIALAHRKWVICFGPREQVFHFHPLVQQADVLEALLEILMRIPV